MRTPAEMENNMKKNTEKKNVWILILLTVLMLLLIAGSAVYESRTSHNTAKENTDREELASDGNGNTENADTVQTQKGEIVIADSPEIAHLSDKESLYENDEDTSVITMYLTVRRGNRSDNTDHSWKDINTYSVEDYAYMGKERYQVEALLQVGDENGPLPAALGYGETAPNATVQIRGQTSSSNVQKNYKIRIKDDHGTWNGQQTIALNKHQTEGLRYRNKMAFDLQKKIPQLMSLRTQFVHLYVKDQTDDPSNDLFQDYGLYTQVEQLNKKALKSHGLDRNGQLYKLNMFEFYREEDVIRLESDTGFDQTAFEERLKIKGNHDHSKLIAMLEEVNDFSVNPDQMLADWFDEENIAYWMAFEILMGNTDSQSRNFYIYSPKNVNRFYILPWDYDGMLFYEEYALKEFSENGSWERGISNYWGNILFRRCLQSEHFREQLREAVEDLRANYVTKDIVTEMAENYAAVVKTYVYRNPDIQYASLTENEYDRLTENIYDNIEQAYQSYLDSLEKPMPFFIGVPQPDQKGNLLIQWDPSYIFGEDTLTYHAQIARDSDMTDIVTSYSGPWPEWTTYELPAGQYFLKVTVTDEEGRSQDAFDYYVTENGKKYGIKCFYVNADGSVSEDVMTD